jgi:hypothetical protein
VANRTISPAGGDYSNILTWVENIVPTNADAVIVTALSGNLIISDSEFCGSANFTNYIGTLTLTSTCDWAIGNSTSGSLTCVAGMNVVADVASVITFAPTATALALTLTCAGKIFGTIGFFHTVVGTTYTLQDDVICLASFGTGTHASVNFNNKNVTCDSFIHQSISGSDVVTFGTGTLTYSSLFQINSGSGVASTSGCNIVATGSTCPFTQNKVANQTWASLTIPSAATCALRGTNTFTTLTIGVGAIINFQDSKTTTVINFTPIGSAGNLITLQSAVIFTLSKSSGVVNGDYLYIKNSTATGGATWNAGIHSINAGGNTGWIFTTTTTGGSPYLNTTVIFTKGSLLLRKLGLVLEVRNKDHLFGPKNPLAR